ncbi:hypothetical protein BN2476_150040 [Paraburkholderia piptadeniae]|uniref:Uncharacterized protein n=1 Tax=Paraburkholderia piptadeniae TaxID=1701573 RepID=A0A1N7RS96_9BURK|nr:hypothetical protein BN2476_150040 [Paraburkholderia piptadeniae]
MSAMSLRHMRSAMRQLPLDPTHARIAAAMRRVFPEHSIRAPFRKCLVLQCFFDGQPVTTAFAAHATEYGYTLISTRGPSPFYWMKARSSELL